MVSTSFDPVRVGTRRFHTQREKIGYAVCQEFGLPIVYLRLAILFVTDMGFLC